jgi:hypothetical protein
MSDPDRGAYTPPTDEPLSFDARQPVRGSRPAPLTLIVSAVVLVLLVIAIVLFYRSGVRQTGDAPATVGAPLGEMKAPPPAEAQPLDPAAGLQIYQSEEPGAVPPPPSFTPPPEEPAPRPAPMATAPVTSAPLPAPAAVTPPPAAPAPKPAVAPAPAASSPKVVTAPAAAPKPASSGAAAVQIGAFSNQAQADKGWDDAARIAPGMIAGKGKKVEPVERNGSTLLRTSVTGFSSRSDAQAFCDALKAAGKNCFVK